MLDEALINDEKIKEQKGSLPEEQVMEVHLTDIGDLYEYCHAGGFSFSMMVLEKPKVEEDELEHCPEYVKEMF